MKMKSFLALCAFIPSNGWKIPGLVPKMPSLHQAASEVEPPATSTKKRWGSFPREGEEMRAKQWLESNVKIALTYDWNGAMFVLSTKGLDNAVLDSFSLMKTSNAQPDAMTYGFAAKSAARCRNWGIIKSLTDEMDNRGIILDVKLWTTILHEGSKEGGSKVLLELFDGYWARHPDLNMDVPALNALIQLRANVGDMNGALKLLSSMKPSKGQRPTLKSYAPIMAAMKRRRDFAGILRLFRTMAKNGPNPDVFMYGMAINAQVELNSWEGALETMTMMKREKVPPNAVIYTLVIGSVAKAGKLSVALDLLRELDEIDDSPSQRAYSQALSGCHQAGDWKSAKALLEQYRARVADWKLKSDDGASSLDVNVHLYTAAISSCIRDGEVDWAFQLYEEMKKDKVEPNIYSFNCLLRVCAENAEARGNLDLVLKSLDYLSASGIELDSYSYSALLTACQRCGNGTMAYSFVDEMLTSSAASSFTGIHLTAAFRACQRSNDAESSVRILKSIRESASRCIDEGVATYVLTTLAAAPSSNKEHIETTLGVLKGLPSRAADIFSPQVNSLLIENLCRSGSIDLAVAVLNDGVKLGYRPRESTYVNVVTACERAGQWRKALRVLDDMRQRGYTFYSNSVLDRLFKSLVQAWSLASKATMSPEETESYGRLGVTEQKT